MRVALPTYWTHTMIHTMIHASHSLFYKLRKFDHKEMHWLILRIITEWWLLIQKKKYLSYSVSHIIFRENESDVIQLNWFKKQISVIPGFLVSYLYLLIFHTFVHSLCIFCSVPPLWANNKKPMNQSLSGGLPSVWWAPKFIHGAGMEEREWERIIKTVNKAWKYMQSSFWKATLFKLWEHFAIIYRITTSKQYISPETL